MIENCVYCMLRNFCFFYSRILNLFYYKKNRILQKKKSTGKFFSLSFLYLPPH